MSDRPQRLDTRPPGVERFLEVYRDARLLPYSPADSRLMAALEGCLNCGTCLAVCPVVNAATEHPYPGPRSVSTSLSRSLPEFWTAADLVGFCTTCMACEEACPGSVPAYRAILMMRAKNFEQSLREGREPLSRLKQLLVEFFAEGRLAAAARWGAALQGLAYKKTASGEMKARIPLPIGPLGNRVVPPLAGRSLVREHPRAIPGARPDGPLVAVFAGCLVNYAYTDTGRSLIEVLRRHSREVVVPEGQVCCGAPALYSGDQATTRRLAAENARAFAEAGADYVVTACATCGDVLVRDYPELFATAEPVSPPEVAGAVRDFAGRVRDIHAFLTDEVAFEVPVASASLGRPPASPGAPLTVTVHDPCHLVRGQGVAAEVRDLLTRIPGVELQELREPSVCCGGAGSFSLEHYDVAAAIRARKVADIEATGAAAVITGCPSCRLHIADGLEQAGLGRPVRHLVDILADAYGAGK